MQKKPHLKKYITGFVIEIKKLIIKTIWNNEYQDCWNKLRIYMYIDVYIYKCINLFIYNMYFILICIIINYTLNNYV